MRTATKNKQRLMYSLYKATSEPEIVCDRNGNPLLDDEGNYVYDSSSSSKLLYDEPVPFYGNIAFASGESEAVAYGVSVGDYDSKLLMLKGELPITETSLIFKDSVPKYDNDGNVMRESADFSVIKVENALNMTIYLLKRIIKNE